MTTNDNSEWVSLRHAAEILGVHPATVRSWADKGDLPSRRTPGGHRRFNKNDLMRYAQTQDEIQPLEVQVIIQNALGSMRMQLGEGNLSDAPWYTAMSEHTRGIMRTEGRLVLDAIRRYLGSDGDDEHLAQAINIGKRYAQALTLDGLTLPQATRGFFYFSDFVINAILTWSEIAQPRNSSEWVHLLRQVNTFINTMLLSIVEYYEEE